jgi:hypothetical protein
MQGTLGRDRAEREQKAGLDLGEQPMLGTSSVSWAVDI